MHHFFFSKNVKIHAISGFFPIYVDFHFAKLGGGDESRTRVRKSIHATFYERSLSIKIPNKSRRQTGCYYR